MVHINFRLRFNGSAIVRPGRSSPERHPRRGVSAYRGTSSIQRSPGIDNHFLARLLVSAHEQWIGSPSCIMKSLNLISDGVSRLRFRKTWPLPLQPKQTPFMTCFAHLISPVPSHLRQSCLNIVTFPIEVVVLPICHKYYDICHKFATLFDN